jgi:TolB protein
MHRLILALLTAVGLAATLALSNSTPLSTAVDSQQLPAAFGGIHPRISPDGTQIAFSYQGAIWRMPRDGGTMTRLTEGVGFDVEPAWSSDGKYIAYVNSPNMGGGTLKVIDAITGKAVPLPPAPTVRGTFANYKLEFHPDGSKILGGFAENGKDIGLAWFDLKTGITRTVVTPPNRSRYRHALSRDGRMLAYTVSMDVDGQQGGNDGPQADIWFVDTQKPNSKPQKLTRFAARIHDLCFEADNQSLCVVSDVGGAHYDLWQVPLSEPERGAHRMTFGQADENRPSVSADGRWLVYSDNRRSATQIVVRDLATNIDRSVPLNQIDYKKATGQLTLKTFDHKSDWLATARVSIQRVDGKYFAPVGALHRVLNNYGHFYCDGKAELQLPVGKYRLRAFRGPEYRTAYRDFEITEGDNELGVELQRWINMKANGWYSGENHIHANYGYGQWYNTPQTMLQQCAGEDLNVCNFMVSNSDTDGVFDREFFRGRADALSTDDTLLYWNQEFRSTIWGHMTLVNLKQVVEPVFTGFKGTTNPWDIPTNSDIADRTHLQNGLVNYTHVAQRPEDPYQNPYTAKSIPVGVALGKIDSLDINNNYAGSTAVWHKLLNCGFHFPATAGTDCFLNRIRSRLPGGDRVYVKVDGPFSYAKWIEAMRQGRSFVTNGPMLELTVNGKSPGETMQLPGLSEVHVVAKARAKFPLSKVELLSGGKVIAEAELSNDKLTATIDRVLNLDRSGWIALRATGPGHADHPVGSQYAHTNPIYVEVKGKPIDARAEAAFFLKWIDRLELAVRNRDRIPSDDLKRHVREQLESARAVYRKLAVAAEE